MENQIRDASIRGNMIDRQLINADGQMGMIDVDFAPPPAGENEEANGKEQLCQIGACSLCAQSEAGAASCRYIRLLVFGVSTTQMHPEV